MELKLWQYENLLLFSFVYNSGKFKSEVQLKFLYWTLAKSVEEWGEFKRLASSWDLICWINCTLGILYLWFQKYFSQQSWDRYQNWKFWNFSAPCWCQDPPSLIFSGSCVEWDEGDKTLLKRTEWEKCRIDTARRQQWKLQNGHNVKLGIFLDPCFSTTLSISGKVTMFILQPT